jgi:hypothetical protein
MGGRLSLPKKATAKSRSKSITLASVRPTLFDQPELLPGEEPAMYQELLTRICETVKPIDIIEHIFINDFTYLEFDVLRWRRLKIVLIRELGLSALQHFLEENLDYNLYADHFTDNLTKFLQEKFPQEKPEHFARVARECAEDQTQSVENVKKRLESIDFDLNDILQIALTERAKDLAQQYGRNETDAITLVNNLLAQAGTSMDALVINALRKKFEYIERIDRMTAVAEARRNACLHEIDRRRALLGESLRRSVQEMEKDEVEVIEITPDKGNKAA